jgi:RNA polymerase-binding transcription factor DksA
LNKRDLQRFQKILLAQREELQGNAKRALSGDIHVDPDDFPDEIDTASSEVTLQFTGRLREREQGLLAKIDAALASTAARTSA